MFSLCVIPIEVLSLVLIPVVQDLKFDMDCCVLCCVQCMLYDHSPAARENTDAHLCNIQPYCLLSHQILFLVSFKLEVVQYAGKNKTYVTPKQAYFVQ